MSYYGYPRPGAFRMPDEDADMAPPFNNIPSHTMYPLPSVSPRTYRYTPRPQSMHAPPPPPPPPSPPPPPQSIYPDWRNENVAVSRSEDRDNYRYSRNSPARNRQPNVRFRLPSHRRSRSTEYRENRTANSSTGSLTDALDALVFDRDGPLDNDVVIAPGGSARITVRIQGGENPQKAVFLVCGRTMRLCASRWNEIQGVDFQAHDAKAIDAMYLVLHLIHMTPAARAHIPEDVQATTLAWVCHIGLVLGAAQMDTLRDHTVEWARTLRSRAGSGLLTSRGDWLFALYAGRVTHDRALCQLAAETMLVQGTVDSEGYWRDTIGRRLDLLPDAMYRKVGVFLEDLQRQRELALQNVARNCLAF